VWTEEKEYDVSFLDCLSYFNVTILILSFYLFTNSIMMTYTSRRESITGQFC
jgi:uncharacterized membrane-anchored protein YitT (DUF2179 family)